MPETPQSERPKVFFSNEPPPEPRDVKPKSNRLWKTTVLVSVHEMKPVMVCSVYTRPFFRNGRQGQYLLPALKAGYDVSAVWIGCGFDDEDFGDGKRRKDYRRPPRQLAADLFMRDNSGMAKRGVFIPAGDWPTWKEIEDATAKMQAYLRKSVERGQIEYARAGRIQDVPAEARDGAALLGIEAPWAKGNLQSASCPACANSINPKAVRCPHCQFIINKAKWAELQADQPKPMKQTAA